MRKFNLTHLAVFSSLLLTCIPTVTQAQATVTLDGQKIEVTPLPEPKATFNYRVTDSPVPVSSIEATVGTAKYTVANEKTPVDDGKSAVYFLLDVSEASKRDEQIKGAKEIILNAAETLVLKNWKVGLAAIGTNFSHYAWLDTGMTKEARESTIRKGSFKEAESSQIWKCSVDAMDWLSKQGQPAGVTRKSLVIISDGDADPVTDPKYGPDELIKLSNQYGIPVFGIGFASTERLQAKWDTMRTVSKQSHGFFFPTKANKAEQEVGAVIHSYLSATGKAIVDLKGIAAGKHDLNLRLFMGNNTYNDMKQSIEVVVAPVVAAVPPATAAVPAPGPNGTPVPAAPGTPAATGTAAAPVSPGTPAAQGAQSTPGTPVTPAGTAAATTTPATPAKEEPAPRPSWFWWAVGGGGAVLLALLIWLLSMLFRSKPQPEIIPVSPANWPSDPPPISPGGWDSPSSSTTVPEVSGSWMDPPSPGFSNTTTNEVDETTTLFVGHLQEIDKNGQESGARHNIRRNLYRIGRSKENDLRLINDTVSAEHAVIKQRRDGSLEINDLNSGNGVYLNARRMTNSVLRDGDVVEIGELRFRFVSAKSRA